MYNFRIIDVFMKLSHLVQKQGMSSFVFKIPYFLFVQDHFQEHFEVFFMVLVKFIHEYFTSYLFVPIVWTSYCLFLLWWGKLFSPSYLFFMAYVFLFISFFNIIKIYIILTQQYDTNSIQVPIDGKLGNTKIYSGT